ncbi:MULTISPECIES: YdcF family protein [unclassified Synechococcus]|uniref:YdcF family protein n=1 Tax=unclassified Synechococcus TaxID=2626047 RepID=UPI0021A59464|nr:MULTISPECIES: YdcF family protein [unclassified Synechococcus]MCT0214580.1 YdcF family protein [Synechococcus sp. CS-1326]MCT0233914.1 YdcF family protein [Synechococcus sp. CS-1327]
MGFLLSKLLPLLVYPLGLSLVMLLTAQLGRGRHWSAWLGGGGIALLWISAMPFTARQLVWGLEERSAALTPAAVPRADAIVVLGGGLQSPLPPRAGVEVNEAGDRLLSGVRLMRADRAPLLLVSGGRVTFRQDDPAPPEALAARNLAVELGVPAARIRMSDQARTTAEEAAAIDQLARQEGWRSVILITSAIHMPRSLATFERRTSLKVIPVACDYLLPARAQLGEPTAGSLLGSMLPDAGSLQLSTLVIKEHLGLLIYRLKGWS